jgi:hypothetical protein
VLYNGTTGVDLNVNSTGDLSIYSQSGSVVLYNGTTGVDLNVNSTGDLSIYSQSGSVVLYNGTTGVLFGVDTAGDLGIYTQHNIGFHPYSGLVTFFNGNFGTTASLFVNSTNVQWTSETTDSPFIFRLTSTDSTNNILTLQNTDSSKNYGSSLYMIHSNGSEARLNVDGSGTLDLFPTNGTIRVYDSITGTINTSLTTTSSETILNPPSGKLLLENSGTDTTTLTTASGGLTVNPPFGSLLLENSGTDTTTFSTASGGLTVNPPGGSLLLTDGNYTTTFSTTSNALTVNPPSGILLLTDGNYTTTFSTASGGLTVNPPSGILLLTDGNYTTTFSTTSNALTVNPPSGYLLLTDGTYNTTFHGNSDGLAIYMPGNVLSLINNNITYQVNMQLDQNGFQITSLYKPTYILYDASSANKVSFEVDISGLTVIAGDAAIPLGVALVNNAIAWASASSRLIKTPVDSNVDHVTNIELLHSIPIDRWYYTADESKREYLGPYAEDIHEKFHLSDGKRISTIDNDGILYSCLKGMYIKHLKLEETVREQQRMITDQQRMITDQQRMITDQQRMITDQQRMITDILTQLQSLKPT